MTDALHNPLANGSIDDTFDAIVDGMPSEKGLAPGEADENFNLHANPFDRVFGL